MNRSKLFFKVITPNQGNTIFQVYHLANLKRAKEEEFVNAVGFPDVSFVPIPKWSALDMGWLKLIVMLLLCN